MEIKTWKPGMSDKETADIAYWERNMLALLHAEGWYNDDVAAHHAVDGDAVVYENKFVQIGEITVPAALAEEIQVMQPIFDAAIKAGIMLECGCCPGVGEICPECSDEDEDEEE